MYENEFTRIMDASQSNSLTFFVGAGVSKLAGAPGWGELISDISVKLGIKPKKEYTPEDYLKIPQMYYYSLEDKDEYYKFVESKIDGKELMPTPIHKEMFDLNPVSFITTNYDTLLEDAAAKFCQILRVVARDKDVPSIAGDRYILKIHGDFRNKNFVLKEEDYLNYSEKFKLIETLLKSIFSTNTVVFIGYSLGDYNIKLILNWAKELLKEDFRKPIFLYVDDVLTKEELQYHESRGLAVIEYYKIGEKNVDYLNRYQLFFDALKRYDSYDISEKSAEEAFGVLFHLLEPLNKLKALRHEDVSRKLSKYDVYIDNNGVLRVWENKQIFVRFIEIDRMNEIDRCKLDVNELRMFNTIKRVFEKACLWAIFDEYEHYKIKHFDIQFGDENCLLFKYKKMNKYVSKQYKTLDSNIKKAYYLYKLYRYKEALKLFIEVARQAFATGDYLSFYFAEINCHSLKILIKKNIYFRGSYMRELDGDLLDDRLIEDLFSKLPFEFRRKYVSLKDIHTTALLYKYAYNSFESADKLDEVIESKTIEYGSTSCDRALSRINDYLHFIQGNTLVVDAFAEYKKSVKRIMEALMHKYSIQNKCEIFTDDDFPPQNDRITFDEIDFYCFIECFYPDEIIRLFRRYDIKTIEFKDNNVIERAVRNIVDYYEMIQKENGSFVANSYLQTKIKNVLALLRYIDISLKLFESVCAFILTNDFDHISIKDKVNFLGWQIYERGKNSIRITRIIEKKLLLYFDEHRKAFESGEEYDDPYSEGVTYDNLADYLQSNGKNYISQELSYRIDLLINNNEKELFSSHYFRHITKSQQKKVLSWLGKEIEQNFDYELLTFLLENNYKISDKVKIQLIDLLKKETAEESNMKCVRIYPVKKRYSKLIQVGYACLLGWLQRDEFELFVGISDEFDFYYQYEGFDFEKFDVRWILRLRNPILKKIVENKDVYVKVRKCIVQAMKARKFTKQDNEKLQGILINYFC
ncbi:SIR2-like domain-containing protein [Butyrivibrio sp. ob235]|uniref:SIR2 family protein n=1 Tax=Butyrivibrio sp. ob235 TaxID=1761780 RepID=UPI0008C20D5F|nr:SIR2 family protein [Butyrivibrio sp. ob235]SEL76750.1 SIR2-like domain-containing protein [Butyrivibrio sp. ob235]